MDLELEYLPLLLIVDMKTKNKWRSVQVLSIFVSFLGHNNINVRNCNRINVVMASPNCINKNLFKMVSSCV